MEVWYLMRMKKNSVMFDRKFNYFDNKDLSEIFSYTYILIYIYKLVMKYINSIYKFIIQYYLNRTKL